MLAGSVRQILACLLERIDVVARGNDAIDNHIDGNVVHNECRIQGQATQNALRGAHEETLRSILRHSPARYGLLPSGRNCKESHWISGGFLQVLLRSHYLLMLGRTMPQANWLATLATSCSARCLVNVYVLG